MLVLQQVCVFLHYSVYTIVCVFYTYKDQIYSHGCKHEVNSPKWGQPEVLIALKVSTEGKGHYACYNKGEGLRLCVSEWGPCKYSMSECVFMCVYVLTLWTQLKASSSVSSISTFVSRGSRLLARCHLPAPRKDLGTSRGQVWFIPPHPNVWKTANKLLLKEQQSKRSTQRSPWTMFLESVN